MKRKNCNAYKEPLPELEELQYQNKVLRERNHMLTQDRDRVIERLSKAIELSEVEEMVKYCESNDSVDCDNCKHEAMCDVLSYDGFIDFYDDFKSFIKSKNKGGVLL